MQKEFCDAKTGKFPWIFFSRISCIGYANGFGRYFWGTTTRAAGSGKENCNWWQRETWLKVRILSWIEKLEWDPYKTMLQYACDNHLARCYQISLVSYFKSPTTLQSVCMVKVELCNVIRQTRDRGSSIRQVSKQVAFVEVGKVSEYELREDSEYFQTTHQLCQTLKRRF